MDSLFDVFTDSLQGWAYYNGTLYSKHVPSMNHTDVTNFNCTLTEKLPDGTFMFECFERDQIWAFITWGILFLPGLQMYSSLITWTTDDEDGDGKISADERASMLTRIGFFLASLFFPITMVCFKV